MSRVVVVGDSLLDRDVVGTADRLCPDAPVPVLRDCRYVERAGGAGLAATLLARWGHQVTLVTAVADDALGRDLVRCLADEGVDVLALRGAGTTAVKTRIRAGAHPVGRLDQGSERLVPYDVDGRRVGRRLSAADAVLVSDYGRGVTADDVLRGLVESSDHRVWDPHPRGSTPPPGPTLVTPNLHEAAEVLGEPAAMTVADAGRQAAQLVARWHVMAVAVTLGGRGALLSTADGPPALVPTTEVRGGDTCGAGDAFAAAAAAALAEGTRLGDAVARAAEEASRFVAHGAASAVARERAASL
jgi:D-beta-D-heptose 7-phosphate kinase / D-beta-D-heptose 1-phosphate adenosyltransferase